MISPLVIISTGNDKQTKIALSELCLIAIYSFCAAFGGAFALSFRKKILPCINQISLLILNTLAVYTIFSRWGYNHVILIPFWLLLTISLLFTLFNVDNSKGFLCIWYLLFLIFLGSLNFFDFIVSQYDENISYFMAFLTGSIGLSVYVYIAYLAGFIPLTGGGEKEVGIRKVKHFSLFINSFKKIDVEPLLLFIFLHHCCWYFY